MRMAYNTMKALVVQSPDVGLRTQACVTCSHNPSLSNTTQAIAVLCVIGSAAPQVMMARVHQTPYILISQLRT